MHKIKFIIIVVNDCSNRIFDNSITVYVLQFSKLFSLEGALELELAILSLP